MGLSRTIPVWQSLTRRVCARSLRTTVWRRALLLFLTRFPSHHFATVNVIQSFHKFLSKYLGKNNMAKKLKDALHMLKFVLAVRQ